MEKFMCSIILLVVNYVIYLGSTVNSDKLIEEVFQYRTTLGNKAYYANQFLFKSRLVCKKSKLKLYCSIVRPIVTCGCEVWVLGETIKKQVNVYLTTHTNTCTHTHIYIYVTYYFISLLLCSTCFGH